MRTYLLFLASLLSLAMSCESDSSEDQEDDNSSSPRILKQSKVIAPAKNAKFKLGDKVSFQIETKSPIDSILVRQDQYSSTYLSTSFDWESAANTVGKQKIRVTVFMNGLKETHYPKFTVLSDTPPTLLNFKLQNTYPHNEDSFIQGLFFYGDTLMESTGQNGESRIMKTNYKTGEAYQTKELPDDYFGEGSTMWNNQFFYLTYTTQIGFKYDVNFNQIGEFRYPHQGWGITTMGDTLLVSDGSEIIRYVDPRDFSEIGQIQVYDHEKAYKEINELEYFNGLLYANVWFEDYIIGIDPLSGKVVEKIDLADLADQKSRSEDVLNGIAYYPKNKTIFVSGKLWKNMYEITFTKE